MDQKILTTLMSRSKRRGIYEFVEMLRRFGLIDRGFEISQPSTSPFFVTQERKVLQDEDMAKAAKDPNRVFVVMGGDGTHEQVKYFARSYGCNIVFLMTTHDHGLTSIASEKKLGYPSAIEILTTAAIKFFGDCNTPKVFIVPGRSKNGLSWEIFKKLEAHYGADQARIACAKSVQQVKEALNKRQSVVCSESLCIEFGAKMEGSITEFPLVDKLVEYFHGQIVEACFERVTGPDLELMDYTLTTEENQILELSASTLMEFIEPFTLGQFSEIPVEFRRFFTNYYEEAGGLINLTGIVKQRMYQQRRT